MLEASDLDTSGNFIESNLVQIQILYSDDYLRLVIVRRPKFGQLMMKREWDPVPWPLKENELYQLEIFRGFILF